MENGIIIPDELRFAITRKCQGECRHCYNRSGKDNDLLSGRDFISILNEVHSLNPKMDRITITGGEPMIEPGRILEISEFCHFLGIRVRLVTRGWELDEEKAHKKRCSLDLSGSNCSAFNKLYSQFDDYSMFMGNYAEAVKQKIT